MALLTFKEKYVIQSTTAVTTTSSALQNDTQASQTFTLDASQTVLVIYQANNNHNTYNGNASGTQCAISIDGSDVANQWDSSNAKYVVRNVCFWIGTLNSGSHTIKGRFSSNSTGNATTISNRILLIYILNGDEFQYVDDSTTITTTSTTFSDDANASVTFTPSGACKALYLYAASNSNSSEDYDGKKIAINVANSDYSQAEKSPYSDTYRDSVFTCYASSLTAVSTTVKGRIGKPGRFNTSSVNRRQLGVLLFADSTLLDVVSSTTQVSTTSNSLVNDAQASISRTTTDNRELLVVAVGSKRYGTTTTVSGECYGIKTSADRQVSRGAPYYNSASCPNSAATCWAESTTAGSQTVQGRFSNNYGNDSAKIDARCVVALWLGVTSDVYLSAIPAFGEGAVPVAKQVSAANIPLVSAVGEAITKVRKATSATAISQPSSIGIAQATGPKILTAANISSIPAFMVGISEEIGMDHEIPLSSMFGLGLPPARLSLGSMFSLIPAAGLGQAGFGDLDTTTGLSIAPVLGSGITTPGKFTSDAILEAIAALGAGSFPAGMSLLGALYLSSALGVGALAQTKLNTATNLKTPPPLGDGFLIPPEIAIAANLGALPALSEGVSPAGLLLGSVLALVSAIGGGQAVINGFTADTALAAIASLGLGSVLSSGVTSEAALNIAAALGLGQSPIASVSAATNLSVLSALGVGLSETAGMSYGISVPAISSVGAGIAPPPGAAISAVLNAVPGLGFGQPLDTKMDSTLSLLAALGMSATPQAGMSVIVNLAAAPSSGVGLALIKGATIEAYLQALTTLGLGCPLLVGMATAVNLQALASWGAGTTNIQSSLSAVDLVSLPAFTSGEIPPAGLNTAAQFQAPALLAQGLTLPAGLDSGLSFIAITALSSGLAGIPRTDIDAAFKPPAAVALSITPSGLIVILSSCQDIYRAIINEELFLSTINKDSFTVTFND